MFVTYVTIIDDIHDKIPFPQGMCTAMIGLLLGISRAIRQKYGPARVANSQANDDSNNNNCNSIADDRDDTSNDNNTIMTVVLIVISSHYFI